jgi:hypothetical protein
MKNPRSLARRAVLLAMLAVGCASAASRSGQSANLLTREEVMAANVSNLYDAVQRLRPRWLNVRGARSLSQLSTEIVVYQDLTHLGGVDVLRQLSPEMISRLRYLDGATATASLPGLGSRHVVGAIVIETPSAR